MSSHSAFSEPSAAAALEPPQPLHAPHSRSEELPPSMTMADLTKDLGTILLALLALGSTFWVGRSSTDSVSQVGLMATLVGLAALGVLFSGILRRVMSRPTLTVHLIRLVPAGLVIAVALFSLLALPLGLRGWTPSGLGDGHLLVLAVGIFAAMPRSGDPLTEMPFLWNWFGLSIVSCLAVAHLLLPVYIDTWNITDPVAGRILTSMLLLVVVAAVSLWSPLQGLRPALGILGLTTLVVKVLVAFEEGRAWFGGLNLVVLGLDEALLIAGLLALGARSEQQSGRRFARAVAVVSLGVAVIMSLLQLVMIQGEWGALGTIPGSWLVAGAGLATIVFLVQQGSRRRAQVFPALGAALALFAAPIPVLLSYGFVTDRLTVSVAVVVLLLVTVVRLDRDPSFEVLPPALKNRHASDPMQLAALEAKAYQQSALVLAVVAVVTGPIGILMGVFAFHRAREAEASGLLTTAPRIIAGFGIIVGIVSLFVVPSWLASLGSAW